MTTFISINLAAGLGKRFRSGTPKQFLHFDQGYLFEFALRSFQSVDQIKEHILVLPLPYSDDFKPYISEHYKRVTIIEGGSNRQDSCFRALHAIKDEDAVVLIHDGARPLLHRDLIINSIHAFATPGVDAVVPILPVDNTLYKLYPSGHPVCENREHYFMAQTPQLFNLLQIQDAHRQARKDQLTFTDDLSLFLHYYPQANVERVAGSGHNFKITDHEDLLLFNALLNSKDI